MGTLLALSVFVMFGGIFLVSKLPEGMHIPFGIAVFFVCVGLAIIGRFFQINISKK